MTITREGARVENSRSIASHGWAVHMGHREVARRQGRNLQRDGARTSRETDACFLDDGNDEDEDEDDEMRTTRRGERDGPS